jgi:glucan phosphorylase
MDAFGKLQALYADRNEWPRMSLRNIKRSWAFSSDETIKKYNLEIWNK